MQVFRFFTIIKFRAIYFWTSQGHYWPLIDKVGLIDCSSGREMACSAIFPRINKVFPLARFIWSTPIREITYTMHTCTAMMPHSMFCFYLRQLHRIHAEERDDMKCNVAASYVVFPQTARFHCASQVQLNSFLTMKRKKDLNLSLGYFLLFTLFPD
jgi:hypothetical protein